MAILATNVKIIVAIRVTIMTTPLIMLIIVIDNNDNHGNANHDNHDNKIAISPS